MLTDITAREAPDLTRGPSTPLDHQIYDLLQDGEPREPRDIWLDLPEGIATLQQIHARLRVLRQRGALIRDISEGAPQRGPGASRYTLP